MNRKVFTIAAAGTALLVAAAAFRVIPGPDDRQDDRIPGAVAVEVTKLSPVTLTETVSAVGTVEAMRDVTVESETAGRVTGIRFNVGDFVEEGDTLVLVDDELKAVALDQAEAQALAAETQAKKAARDLERAEVLHKSQDVSDAELEAYRLAGRSAEAGHQAAIAALRAARRQLADTRIRAPIAGYVAAKLVEVGEMVRSGKQVANIVDLRRVKVKLSIPEEEIVKLRAGQHATMELDASPGVKFAGTVGSVGAKSESSTGHTYPVEVLVDNDGTHGVRAGMFARVGITANVVRGAIAVPRDWVLNEDSRPIVFVARADTARAVPVTLGARSGDSVRVLNGLEAGDLVISFGQKTISDGTPVRFNR
jgi:RND family efflux transporter MFP subunit